MQGLSPKTDEIYRQKEIEVCLGIFADLSKSMVGITFVQKRGIRRKRSQAVVEPLQIVSVGGSGESKGED